MNINIFEVYTFFPLIRRASLHIIGHLLGLHLLTVLVVIPALSRNTVTSLAHRGLFSDYFFYSKKNNLVQLEDPTVKAERESSITAV